MADIRPPRKLAVILYADVAGYSRHTERDEMGTHREVMEMLDYATGAIAEGGGSVLRYAGDAVLAEFRSAVAAVESAVGIQNQLWSRNAGKDEPERIQIRIGLNVGEVIQDRNEIFGDGVNLAARLESTAEPGGICISANVHEQIAGKVDVNFADGGAETFKNIERPVRVFRWHPGITGEAKRPDALPLPDKPSIAVLPFDNISNDPEQDFFVDGISEDIITELSRDKDLFVIARHSSFAYRGKSADVKQIARELGVRYVLEGSVRRAGDRIRLNAQLIDAQSSRHVWAERYDRALEDVFEVQDELTRLISNTLLQKFRDIETERVLRNPPRDMAAYDHYLRAFGLALSFDQNLSDEAIREAQTALAIDPDYARAHMALAWAHGYRVWSGWVDDIDDELAKCRDAALRAVACDREDFWAYGALAFAELFARNHQRALDAIDRAVALNPNNADSRALRALILNFTGDPERSLGEMEIAMRLNPIHPYWYLLGIGRALFLLGRYDEAIPHLERLNIVGKDVLTWRALLIANYMGAGRTDAGRAEAAALLRANPGIRCQDILARVPLRDPDAVALYRDLLKASGIPD